MNGRFELKESANIWLDFSCLVKTLLVFNLRGDGEASGLTWRMLCDFRRDEKKGPWNFLRRRLSLVWRIEWRFFQETTRLGEVMKNDEVRYCFPGKVSTRGDWGGESLWLKRCFKNFCFVHPCSFKELKQLFLLKQKVFSV